MLGGATATWLSEVLDHAKSNALVLVGTIANVLVAYIVWWLLAGGLTLALRLAERNDQQLAGRAAVVVVAATSFAVWFIAREPNPTPSEAERSKEPRTPPRLSFSENDLALVGDLSRHTREWNRTAAPMVRDYLDPTISREMWLRSSSESLDRLSAIHAKLQADIVLISSRPARDAMQRFADNYAAKLHWTAVLRKAVAAADMVAEQAALNSLDEASEQGRALAMSFLDEMRPYIDPEVLRAAMESRTEEMNELLEAR